MTTNPERLVIEEIDQLETTWAAQDALIDQHLARDVGFDDYHRPWHDRSGQVRCEVCQQEWHGLESENGCPSEFGTDEEKAAYLDARVRQLGRVTPHPAVHDLGVAVSRIRRPALTGALADDAGVMYACPVMRASPEMARALTEHVTRYPQDEEALMRRFGSLIFAGDGTPVPWTLGGLRTVLGGDPSAVDWARRQLGIVDLGGFYDLGRVAEEGVVFRERQE